MSSTPNRLPSVVESLSFLRADTRFISGESEKTQSTTSLVTSTVASKRTRLRNVETITRNSRGTAQSILEWYRILRVHYHWPLFQAIRFALWLSR
jgi:hypothetical protein